MKPKTLKFKDKYPSYIDMIERSYENDNILHRLTLSLLLR